MIQLPTEGEMTKQERHFAIKEIVASIPIVNQEDLRRRLARRGCRVTQATLSRDIKDLGLGRVAGPRGRQYVLQAEGGVRALRPIVGAEVLSILSNEMMIVVKTLPGCANTVGEFIDILRHPDIIGTVAGDNTLLVIPQAQSKTALLEQFLKHQLSEGR
jgi:transcriptional regulator of arginine metabolism